ncbi:MAG: imidazole glycerol phosphate synthase subunit HisH [Parvularculaceae bacterium]
MTETVAIVDYGSGNLRSAQKAFERAARETGRPARVIVSDKPDDIGGADRVVLPGVGAFAACMAGLAARPGLLEALEHAVLTAKRPFLGVCVGMQLLAERGLEFGETRGLAWLPGEVRRLALEDPSIKIPHMGWNDVEFLAPGHPLCAGVDGADAVFYFVHSFHFAPENDAHLIGVSVHGQRFAAMVGRDNIAGVQFHPEKSQAAGLRLISNFLAWDPA